MALKMVKFYVPPTALVNRLGRRLPKEYVTCHRACHMEEEVQSVFLDKNTCLILDINRILRFLRANGF